MEYLFNPLIVDLHPGLQSDRKIILQLNNLLNFYINDSTHCVVWEFENWSLFDKLSLRNPDENVQFCVIDEKALNSLQKDDVNNLSYQTGIWNFIFWQSKLIVEGIKNRKELTNFNEKNIERFILITNRSEIRTQNHIPKKNFTRHKRLHERSCKREVLEIQGVLYLKLVRVEIRFSV